MVFFAKPSSSTSCISCNKTVTTRQHAVQCERCSLWQHRLCNSGVSFQDYKLACKGAMTTSNKFAEKLKNEAGFIICFDKKMSKTNMRSIIIVRSLKKIMYQETKEKQIDSYKSKSMNDETEHFDSSKYVALDCEFVGIGPRGCRSALGRCSIVDYNGHCLLDIYAKPDDVIQDYRTRFSGIRKRHMRQAVPFEFAQNTIKKILHGKILIGHALKNDLVVLKINHPKDKIIDTSECSKLKSMAGFGNDRNKISLKRLSSVLLGREIQIRSHCSLQDAIATMDLFKISISKLAPISVVESQSDRNSAKKRKLGNCIFQNQIKKLKSSLTVSTQEKQEKNTIDPDDSWTTDPFNVNSKRNSAVNTSNHSYFSDKYWPDDIHHTTECKNIDFAELVSCSAK